METLEYRKQKQRRDKYWKIKENMLRKMMLIPLQKGLVLIR